MLRSSFEVGFARYVCMYVCMYVARTQKVACRVTAGICGEVLSVGGQKLRRWFVAVALGASE